MPAVKVSALVRHSIHCAVAAAAQVDVSKGEHLQESYAEIHPSQLTPALGALRVLTTQAQQNGGLCPGHGLALQPCIAAGKGCSL